MKKLLIIALLACLAGSASAAEYFWWGWAHGGGADGVYFDNVENWSSPWPVQNLVLPGSADVVNVQATTWMGPGYPTLTNSAVVSDLFLGLDKDDYTPGASLTITATGHLTTTGGDGFNNGIQIGFYSDAFVTSAGTVDTGAGGTVLGAGAALPFGYGNGTLTNSGGSWTTVDVSWNNNSTNHVQLNGGTLETWGMSGLHETNQTMDITGGTLIFHTTDTAWFGWIKTLGLTGYGSTTNLTGHHDGNTWIITATGPLDLTRGDSIFLFNSGSTGSLLAGYWALLVNDGNPTNLVHPGNSWVLFTDTTLTPSNNIPLVGDFNGDGISDVAGYGKNGDNHTLIMGRNTGMTNVAPNFFEGSLLEPTVGATGWPTNATPFWNPSPDPDFTHYFTADVDGDGKDDAVAARPAPWDTTASLLWQANRSDAEGLESLAPITSQGWYGGLANIGTPLVGDFNGDGAVDTANQDSTGFIVGQVSTPGVGLDGTNPMFWGGMGFQPNHITTLVGDIDGDGIDDIVQVDDRNSNGSWTWMTGLTALGGGTPAGIDITFGGATSWASPFVLHPNSISATPLLADMNNDGRDDLVLYEEYLDVGGTGTVWGRLLTSLTDDPAGGLFMNGFDFATFYDYVATFGVDASGMIPMVGSAHTTDQQGYYRVWAHGFGLTDTNTTAALDFDFESDGLDNLSEYALGGNPLVDDAATYGLVTTSIDTDNWDSVYRRRVDAADRGLAYDLQYKLDLILDPAWTSTGGTGETTNTTDSAFDVVTNSISITGLDRAFLNLEITGSF